VVGTWGGGGNEDILVLGAGVEAAVPPLDWFWGDGGMGTTEVADLIDEVDNRFFFLSGRPEGGGILVFVLGLESLAALANWVSGWVSAGKFGSFEKSITS
jgi:hypothetical protein